MRRFAFGVMSAVLPAMAIAQAPTKAPPQVWQLDWQKNHCTISTGDAATIGLAVWMTPGDPRPDVYLIGSPKTLPGVTGKTLTITLLPSGKNFTADVRNLSESLSVRAMEAQNLSEEFPADFSSSTEVRITGLQGPASVTVIGADKAMTALRHQCIDQKLSEWGIDPNVYDALRLPPIEPPGGLWYTADDYPSEAQSKGEEGAVVARMDVDAKGKVTGCAVVVSSGSTSLDDVTCQTALKRGRFRPAIGTDGRPMAASRILNVTWDLEM